MIRFAFFVFIVVCNLAAPAVRAADVPVQVSPQASPQASTEVARLMAREIASRAQGGGFANGRFTPAVPRPAIIPSTSASAAQSTPNCDVKGLAADVVDENGMRFMPLRRESTRPLKMPMRGEVIARAQALQAAVVGGKSESALAQTALQSDAQVDPRVQAETELANITGEAAPAADANALAKEAVLREIQKYRAAHGKF